MRSVSLILVLQSLWPKDRYLAVVSTLPTSLKGKLLLTICFAGGGIKCLVSDHTLNTGGGQRLDTNPLRAPGRSSCLQMIVLADKLRDWFTDWQRVWLEMQLSNLIQSDLVNWLKDCSSGLRQTCSWNEHIICLFCSLYPSLEPHSLPAPRVSELY